MILSLAFVTLASPAFPASSPVQDDPPAVTPVSDTATDTAGEVEAPADEPIEVNAEALRTRIRDMRMNLLLGGDQVRRAEEEAVDFYGRKTQSVENRIDDVATELVELRATYDVTLDRALAAPGSSEAKTALAEAQPIRAKIASLETEADNLNERRGRLSELVAAVEERDRERRRLVDQLESSSIGPAEFAMPMMSIGLAPDAAVATEASAPLEDDALFEDLYARDPRGAKSLLFSSDPARYWERFPLSPPSNVLRQAIRFPRPDPVGSR